MQSMSLLQHFIKNLLEYANKKLSKLTFLKLLFVFHATALCLFFSHSFLIFLTKCLWLVCFGSNVGPSHLTTFLFACEALCESV